ncbi:cupin-like domain-containing protein [Streptomyces sp. IBSBF 2953]|uniref:cupin-like domain-containing protein n=1 Tax=Streptomyces TaxID=1883 RepID=UPI00211A8609|nr:cupin-like domain-containing protein [Streptomyces scabiei]MCQ9182137.1 cupin-like domain-containing protein [Streptomyces hayashii]MDX3117920.1 cupin-like domain-containing protein [Streptomyces scabiei]
MPGARSLGHVDIISSLPEEPLTRASVLTTTPVVIRGSDALGAMRKWTPEYISERLGEREMPVSIADADGAFRYNLDTRQGLRYESMPGSRLAAEFRDTSSGRRLSMQQMSIPGALPELHEDLTVPPCVPAASLTDVNLWMASGASNTPLHYDNMNNLFAQLDGTKRFLLFSPAQSDLLYPGPLDIRTRHLSRVDVRAPDLRQFPRFEQAEYWEAVVEPGDLLFLPAFWWHQVSAQEEASVSVNYWWRGDVRDCACPSFYRQLYLDLVMEDVRGLFLTHDMSALGSGSDAVLALAERAVDEGEAGVAARLCGAVVVAVAKAACAEAGSAAEGGLDHAFTDLEKRSVWSPGEAALARRALVTAQAARPGRTVPPADVRRTIEELRASTLTWEHAA